MQNACKRITLKSHFNNPRNWQQLGNVDEWAPGQVTGHNRFGWGAQGFSTHLSNPFLESKCVWKQRNDNWQAHTNLCLAARSSIRCSLRCIHHIQLQPVTRQREKRELRKSETTGAWGQPFCYPLLVFLEDPLLNSCVAIWNQQDAVQAVA